MTDKTKEHAMTRDERLAKLASGFIEFDVEGVGHFVGRRLSAFEHIGLVAKRDKMLLEQLRSIREQASDDEVIPVSIEGLSFEIKLAAYQIAFLEQAEVTSSDDVPREYWDGPRNSDPDVVGVVYNSYHAAKGELYRSDKKAVEELKNSSGGSGEQTTSDSP